MKFKLKPLAMGLLSGFFMSQAQAVSNQALQAEVSKLQKDVAALKRQSGNNVSNLSGRTRKNTHVEASSYSDDGLQQYLPFDPDVQDRHTFHLAPTLVCQLLFQEPA